MWPVIQVISLVVGVASAACLIVLVRSWRRTRLAHERAVASARTIVAEAHQEAAQIRSASSAEAQRVVAEARDQAEADAAKIRREADEAAATTTARARAKGEESEREIHAQRTEVRERQLALHRRERRIAEREAALDLEGRRVEQRSCQLAALDTALQARTVELADLEACLESERRAVLERTAALTADQAKSELVSLIANDAKRQAAVLVRDVEQQAQQEADKRARKIITSTIQRLATEQTTESVVSVLHLRSDDMKGRIIGREGRNIRAFEQVTGVNLIVDDTPEAVLLSCFDPVRREVARVALEHLVLDGRIHPHRIEEVYERSQGEVAELCVRAGEDALVDTGLTDLDPALVRLLGSLRYRTSYGQNVLKHLVESAHIAALLAAEIGLDPGIAKRAALLHDIGKALTHKAEGSHARVGAEVARRHGEAEDVVHAIEAHHNEVAPQTVEAVLTQAADAISGGRPGARRESLEAFVTRLERLEQIALAHAGVEKVFAMQAGREVRVMVLPEVVDDAHAQVLARDIAKQVEDELSYPGQIRITVVRESRATETAS